MADFDPTKPVRTRDGRPARIICTDAKKGDYPIIALVTERESENEEPWTFTAEGKFNGCLQDAMDLVNAPQRHVRWVNFYRGAACSAHVSQGRANDLAGPGRIACIRVPFEEGEGLDDG